MEKKGLNFLVGLGGLWLLWKIYSMGWLHKVGFLAIDYCANTSLASEEAYSTTPLALFATLLIDAVAVFGSLLILFTTGIWELLMQAGGFIQDMIVALKEYLETFKKDIPAPLPKPAKDESEVSVDNSVEKDINPLEVILLELKSLSEKQEKIVENQNLLKTEVEKLKEPKNE
jgi:hypothetical protein